MHHRLPILALFFLLPFPADADWPQILGPSRDGSTTEPLPYEFPEDGPSIRWRVTAGEGFGGVAVVGDSVFLGDRVEDRERVAALKTADGTVLWRKEFPVSYRGGIVADGGPRTVPTVAEGRVFSLGVAGNLRAFDGAEGTVLWQVDLVEAFEAQEGYFGFGSSPLVDGDRLIVNVGGETKSKGASIVAFSVESGEVLWQVGDDGAGYSSPIGTSLAGRRQVVVASRFAIRGIDAESGTVFWQDDFGRRGPSVVGAVPLSVGEDRLFFTASYGVGARLVRITADSFRLGVPETAWNQDGRLSSQYSTPVRVGDHLYGNHGREDVGRTDYRALELESGHVAWSEKGFGVAHTIVERNKLLIQKLDGTLVLARAHPQSFQKYDQARVVDGVAVRALPAYSGGVLYLRTTPDRGGGELLAVELLGARGSSAASGPEESQ